jgi:hypothetical protein
MRAAIQAGRASGDDRLTHHSIRQGRQDQQPGPRSSAIHSIDGVRIVCINDQEKP